MITRLLEMENISKDFRGVPALKNVDFNLEAGQVHALLGENGAGKSTLMKILAGAIQQSSGKVILNGAAIEVAKPADALSAGIAMVYQETSLVPSLTVAQNLYLGDEQPFNRLRGLWIQAQQFLQSLNFGVDPAELVSNLGAAQKQMVEIARAVEKKAKIIIFDEPTATLTPEEKHHFFALINRLRDRGVAMVFITHALEEALEMADQITILRDGNLVETGPAAEFTRERVVAGMVGRELSEELHGNATHHRALRPAGERILSVENLSMQKIVRNNSFSVFAGQVTGVFGLVGSGRTETAKVISGVAKRDFFHGGEIKFKGKPIRYLVPRPAVLDGIVYVTEDRKIEGFFETKSIAENIFLGHLAGGDKPESIISMTRMREMAAEWTKKLNVRALDNDARMVELSGGNQQKVVIAKALVQRPDLIIFDEPTRGVDVGAIAEIHHLIEDLANQGIAVLVISSYLPEILSISDRILVSRQGKIVEEFNPRVATAEKIMFAAVH